MAYEVVAVSPKTADFTALSEHQEQTPGTFFGGKPVLHLSCPSAKLKVSKNDLASQPDFAALQDTNDTNAEDDAPIEIPGIDVWVTSKYFTTFSQSKSKGVQIPYQTISIHAQDGDAVLLELNLSEPDVSDEDMVFIQLRIIPDATEHYQVANGGQTNGSSGSSSQILYNAISACQELNPDPPSDEEGEGGFDETAPGATGWITSENMGDFMDEDGNFKMPEGVTVFGGEEEGEAANGLGEGAGHRRTADEAGGEDGADDEAKWQRTG